MNNSEFSNGLSGFSSDYIRYLRPSLGKVLRGMRLDLDYFDGKKDTLYTRIDGENVKILDLTGGYGANLLGHKNKEIEKHAIAVISEGPPNHLQGTIRKSAVSLAKKLNNRLQKELAKEQWITHFSNSGAEAVEAAIKHSIYHFDRRLTHFRQDANENFNALLCFVRSSGFNREKSNKLVKSLTELEKIFFNKKMKGDLEARLRNIYDAQKNCIDKISPIVGGLDGAFHGKTLGALQVMGSSVHLENLRGFKKADPFSWDLKKFESEINQYLFDVPQICPKSFSIKTNKFLSISAFFVEPILGEGGIVEVPKELIEKIREICSKHKTLMVSDEIQAGLYRTGYFASLSHYEVEADVYLFSKGLGGGIAKIGATLFRDRDYTEIMGIKHSSTFAEDHFSSAVAEKVIDTLQPELVVSAMEVGDYFKTELLALKTRFPHLIVDVRGRGLLLGIDFDLENFKNISNDFQLFHENGILSYFLSATLLHREGLRISPSLSSPSTLRIEPSLYFTKEEVNQVISGLSKLLSAAQSKNTDYFFFQEKVRFLKPLKSAAVNLPDDLSDPVDAVFFSHLIDAKHAQGLFKSMANESLEQISHNIYDFKEMQKYIPFHRGVLHSQNGDRLRYMFMSIPYTTQEFISAMINGKRDRIVNKIQIAMQLAKKMGAKTIGLGQFNSIISNNGLKLDCLGMNLTTGNAYTVFLTYLAAQQEMKRRGLKPEDTHICCVGAAGNIMAMVSRLLVPYCSEMTLINRTAAENSPQFRQSIVEILNSLKQSTNVNQKKLKKRLLMYDSINSENVLEIMTDPLISSFLNLSKNNTDAKKSNIVICGTSSARPILGRNHISEGTLVIDVSVPSNIKDEVYSIKNVDVIGGGQARLPDYMGSCQSVDAPGFPLDKGLVYACMAETFSIALSKEQNILHAGEIDIKMVKAVEKMAGDAGITLGKISRLEITNVDANPDDLGQKQFKKLG